MIAVMLSSMSVHAVLGSFNTKPSVRKIISANLPVGLISSGVVINEEALTAFLQDFWKKERLPREEIILVLGTSQLVNKVITAPSTMKESELVSYFTREFTDFNRGSNTAFGCFKIEEMKEQKLCTLLATGADRDYLKTFTRIFSAVGLKIHDIVSELSGILSILLSIRELQGKTSIIQYYNGVSLTNVLIADGKYAYSNSYVIPFESGTPAFSVGVARQVSQLLQFIKAQNMTCTVENIYLAGMSEDDIYLCSESISQMNSTLAVSPLAGANSFGYALSAVGALGVNCGKMGLFRQIGRDPETLMERAERRKRFLPVIILAAVAFTACSVTYTVYFINHLKLTSLVNYNNSATVIEAVEEYDSLLARNNVLQGKIRGIDSDIASLSLYPAPGSNINDVFTKCAAGLVDVEISSYDSSTGVISTVTTAENVENINYFAKILAGESIFSDVNYTGYVYDQGKGVWRVNVVCTLAPEAGK